MAESREDVWQKLEDRFGGGLELQDLLFLIGMQELGQGQKKFSKSEKMDLFHIGTCASLATMGYYERIGTDDQGWPHFKSTKPMPELNLDAQEQLLMEGAFNYLENSLD